MKKIIFNKIEEIFDAREKSKYRNKSIEELKKIYAQKMISYHNYEKRHLSRYTPEQIRKDSNLTRIFRNYENRKTYDAKFSEMCNIKSKKSLIDAITIIDSTNKSLNLNEYLVKLIALKNN